MRLLNLPTVVVLWSGTLGAEPTADELQAMRSKLVVLDDGNHHYLAYALDKDPGRTTWFYGDRKALVQLPMSMSRPDIKHQRIIWAIGDPRYHTRANQVLSDFDTNEFAVTCDKRTTPFHSLAANDAAKLLESAQITPRVKGRYLTFLGRDDDNTTYYYVDRPETSPSEPDSLDYRLFIGKRGATKPIAIKDQTVDSAGVIVITAVGTLRYTNKTKVLEWLPTKGKPHVLTQLTGAANDWDLIYNQLGVFTGQRFGTPCDDL